MLVWPEDLLLWAYEWLLKNTLWPGPAIAFQSHPWSASQPILFAFKIRPRGVPEQLWVVVVQTNETATDPADVCSVLSTARPSEATDQ